MDAQPFIKEIARGREGARGLSYEAATRMFDAMFGGGFADVELGAVLGRCGIDGHAAHGVNRGR